MLQKSYIYKNVGNSFFRRNIIIEDFLEIYSYILRNFYIHRKFRNFILIFLILNAKKLYLKNVAEERKLTFGRL